MTWRTSAAVLAVSFGCGNVFGAGAEPAGYPTRPIRIIVAYTPAGTTDILQSEIAKWQKVIRDAGVKPE